jgi:hypothetical protein
MVLRHPRLPKRQLPLELLFPRWYYPSVMIAVPRRHSMRLSTRLSTRRSTRRSMRLSSFVATLLSGVLTFQLALAGGGMLCLMPSGDGMPAMQTMQQAMPGALPAASRVLPHGQQHAGKGEAGAPADQPCDGHGQPVQCVTMAACAPSVVPVARAVTLMPPRVPAVVVSAPIIVPPSQTSAPELPPPRP